MISLRHAGRKRLPEGPGLLRMPVGKLDGTLEPFTDSGLLLLKHLWVQGHEVVRLLDGRVGGFEVNVNESFTAGSKRAACKNNDPMPGNSGS